MVGAGQASAAKHPNIEAEITAVLLRQDIRGDLRSAKDGMRRAVDATLLADALVVGGIGIVVARCMFLQRLLIGRVAINLIGAEENETRFWAELVHGLENIGRA